MKFLSLPIILLTLWACTPAAEQGGDIIAQNKENDVISNIIVESENDFATTEEKLEQAIQEKGLKLFAVVDHGAGAQSVDQDIGQSKLFIFGNPKAGTPLMIDNAQMGLELPLKILLTLKEGEAVKIIYSDIKATASAYEVTGKDQLLSKISQNLNDLAMAASKP